MTPVVSVIMNGFNSSNYLAEAFDSVLNQTFTDWEIIFWDNGSSDNTREIVTSMGDPRIRYLYKASRESLYVSRMRAVNESRGEYLAFLDCDDVWRSIKLERQLRGMAESHCDISCTDYMVDFSAVSRSHAALHVKTYRKPQFDVVHVARDYRVAMSTVMARASRAKTTWPTEVSSTPPFFMIEDFDMVCRIVASNGILPISEPMTIVRRHGQNYSAKIDAYANEWSLWIPTLDEFRTSQKNKRALGKIATHNQHRYKSRDHLLRGERTEAVRHWRRMKLGIDKIKIGVGILLPLKLVSHLRRDSTRIDSEVL